MTTFRPAFDLELPVVLHTRFVGPWIFYERVGSRLFERITSLLPVIHRFSGFLRKILLLLPANDPIRVLPPDDERDRKPSVLVVRHEFVTHSSGFCFTHEEILQCQNNLSRQSTVKLSCPLLACGLRQDERSGPRESSAMITKEEDVSPIVAEQQDTLALMAGAYRQIFEHLIRPKE